MGDQKREERASAPTVAQGRRSSPSAPPPAKDPDAGPGAFDPPDDRFEARGELGRGGMGRVDVAFDRALGREVAIKHMLSANGVDLARFEREARITARLEHPGIVPIHDAGRTPDGTPYYVMRKIDGKPLDELVAGASFAERLALVPNLLAACDACAFAHARQVIHRDIKPTNILIGPFGETLVIDWGLARAIGEGDDAGGAVPSDPALTRAGVVAGTPGFMAPEQARGEALDARADVFALGATLFFVIAGALPYAATGATEMIDHVGNDRPPDWRRIPDDTPPDLRAIIVKAMAADPRARYRDAGELAADLRRFVSGQLVGAYRYGNMERLRRFVRRHRVALAVAAVAAIVIAVGAVLSVRRIVTERDDANRARELAEAQRREARSASDRMLVQRALQLAERDPTAAILALRTLSPESTEWELAATAAEAAAAAGIPFGFHVESHVGVFEVSRDSRHVAIKTVDAGMLYVFDLVARTRTPIVVLPRLFHVRWIDARWLAALDKTSLTLIDTETRATRVLAVPEEGTFLESDRDGHLALLAQGRVYELDAARTGWSTALAGGVRDVRSIGDGRFVLAQDDRLVVLGRDGALTPLDGATGPFTALIASGTEIAAQNAQRTCMWDVAGAAPRLLQCLDDVTHALFAMRHGNLYMAGGGVWIGARGKARQIATDDLSLAVSIPHGALFGLVGGGLEIDDDHGVYRTGSPGLSYVRGTVTADGRFLIVLTSTDELLVWDLDRDRPRDFTVSHDEKLIGLTTHAVWTMQLGGSVRRYDRATGERSEMGNDFIEASVDPDERWIGVTDSRSFSPQLVELATGVTHLFPKGTLLSSSGDTAYAALPSGEIQRVQRNAATRIGAFPAAPAAYFGRGERLTAQTTDGQLCRFLVSSRALACAPADQMFSEVAIADDGAVLGIAEDGKLWRFDGTRLALVPLAPLAIGFWFAGDTLVVVGHNSLTTLAGAEPHTLAIPAMQRYGPGSSAHLFAVAPSGDAMAIDVASGLTFRIPLARSIGELPFESHGDAAAGAAPALGPDGGQTMRIDLYELRVPRDPAALRAWLATVTNARAVPGSDVVAWP